MRALVTGGARGIGRGIATALIEGGMQVVVADLDGDAAAATAEQLGAAGAARANVADEASVAALREQVLEQLGGLDVLVNNAGVALVKTLADTSPADWDRVLGVNLRGVYLCCRAFAPDLASGGGAIVNVSSIAGRRGGPLSVAYTASKFGVIGLTQALAAELAPHVRVNAVCPGTVVTPLMEAFAHDQGTEVSDWLVQQAIQRPQTPEEIGEAVRFLACAASITGQALNVDGGTIFS